MIVTDGKSNYVKLGDMEGKSAGLLEGEILLALIARFSVVNAVMEKKIENLDKDFLLKNFKLGVKEMVGKREAQVVQYQIQHRKIGDLATVSVWIDTSTHLPLKRAMVGTYTGRSTETYHVFTVNSKLDGKLFEIPPR